MRRMKETKKAKRVTAVMSYEERKAKGRPIVSLSLPAKTVATLARIAEVSGESKSAIVAQLVDAEGAKKKYD